MQKKDVYMSRYHRVGGSYAVVIPVPLREEVGFLPGDTVAMNFSHGIIWMVRVTPEVLIPREKVTAIFDKLFPDKVAANGSDK